MPGSLFLNITDKELQTQRWKHEQIKNKQEVEGSVGYKSVQVFELPDYSDLFCRTSSQLYGAKAWHP